MSVDDPIFVAWEEHIVRNERGSRAVNYHLKEADGNSVLAVLGTERSIRHMMYVISDEFVKAYESKKFINPSTKWRARREVVEWLTSMTSKKKSDSPTGDLAQGLGSLEVPEQTIPRKLKAPQTSSITWSGAAWICTKQLKHYPSFCRNETTISVHSFVFIMGEEGNNYLGYLEDMYEDKKGLKKVKVRWFHRNGELKHVMSQLNPHPREVFITPHVQVISAECVDGLATVLTPMHFEKCANIVQDNSHPTILMCSRQFRNKRIETFTLTKLRGYHSQAIFSSIHGLRDASMKKIKCHKTGEENITLDDPAGLGTKRKRSCKGNQGVENSTPENQTARKLKLKIRLSKNGIKFVEPQPQNHVSLKVGDKVEYLSQDSGINGCWFRCKILRANEKRVKLQYDDLEDAEESGKNLEEWVPACIVVNPDKLSMRCTGRHTIRPPPENLTNPKFEVGAAVDAWWCDGWWESVITKVESIGNCLQIYLPGESKFMTVDRNTVRVSRDWVGNRWVDIKVKPDILSFISGNATLSVKLPIYPPVITIVASGGGSSASLGTIPESDEERQLEQLPQVKIKGGNIDVGVKGSADEAGNNNHGGAGGKDQSAMEVDMGKCEVNNIAS